MCGGRDYQDLAALSAVLNGFDIVELCHGAAPGADSLAGTWALARGIPVRTYPADWDTHGIAAGPIRNRQMLDEFKPDLVIAFPGGKGTKDMCMRAAAAGVRLVTA